MAEEVEKKKATDIVLIKVADFLYLTDYFLIASVGSSRQMRSVVEAVRDSAMNSEVSFIRVEGSEKSGWVLVDLGDVVVHLFETKLRSYYQLERLWKDAPIINFRKKDDYHKESKE